MTTATAEAPEAHPPTTHSAGTEAPKPKSALRRILSQALLVLFGMLVGAAVIFFGNAAHEKGTHAEGEHGEAEAEQGHADAEGHHSGDDPGSDLVEVPVDAFNVTNRRAAAGLIVHVSLKVIAVVSKNQHAAFEDSANNVHKGRVREAIVNVIRSATMDNLEDPHMSTIKRLIREEINKVLRQSYVVEVVINDFRTMEQ